MKKQQNIPIGVQRNSLVSRGLSLGIAELFTRDFFSWQDPNFNKNFQLKINVFCIQSKTEFLRELNVTAMENSTR